MCVIASFLSHTTDHLQQHRQMSLAHTSINTREELRELKCRTHAELDYGRLAVITVITHYTLCAPSQRLAGEVDIRLIVFVFPPVLVAEGLGDGRADKCTRMKLSCVPSADTCATNKALSLLQVVNEQCRRCWS